jgi:hypothetical protein
MVVVLRLACRRQRTIVRAVVDARFSDLALPRESSLEIQDAI